VAERAAAVCEQQNGGHDFYARFVEAPTTFAWKAGAQNGGNRWAQHIVYTATDLKEKKDTSPEWEKVEKDQVFHKLRSALERAATIAGTHAQRYGLLLSNPPRWRGCSCNPNGYHHGRCPVTASAATALAVAEIAASTPKNASGCTSSDHAHRRQQAIGAVVTQTHSGRCYDKEARGEQPFPKGFLVPLGTI
jgi:hypothetical protein